MQKSSAFKRILSFGQIAVVFAMIFSALLINAEAKSFLPSYTDTTTDTSTTTGDTTTNNSNNPFEEELTKGQIPVPPQGLTGQQILNDVVINRGLTYVKNIALAIGILFVVIIGYNMLIKGDQEEEISTQKRAFIYTLISFMMISMGEELAKIFDMGGDRGTIIENAANVRRAVALFDIRVQVAITFIKYVIGSFATLMVVRSGIKMVTAGGDEEQTSTHKKSILYSGGGLLLIFIGEVFITRVFYKIDPNYNAIQGVHPYADAKAGVEQIVGITNFLTTLVAPLAVLMMVIAAIMYATANGNDEQMDKAKRMITTAIVAMFIIFGAFAIVNTVISGRLAEMGALTE